MGNRYKAFTDKNRVFYHRIPDGNPLPLVSAMRSFNSQLEEGEQLESIWLELERIPTDQDIDSLIRQYARHNLA